MEFIDLNNPIFDLIEKNDYKNLYIVLNQKFSLNVKNRFGLYPLEYACKIGNSHCVKLLLIFGADPNLMNNKDCPLHVSVMHSNLECIKILLEFGADTTKKDGYEKYPIYYVKDFESLSILKEYGADINIYNPLWIFVEQKNIEMVEIYLKAGAKQNIYQLEHSEWNYPFCKAIMNSSNSIIKLFFKYGVDWSVSYDNKNPAFHIACNHLSIDMIDFFLNNGVDMSRKI